MSTHDCVSRVNENLKAAGHNTAIHQALSFTNPSDELIVVGTVKANASLRVKPMKLFATFCPFCGVKLNTAKEPPQ